MADLDVDLFCEDAGHESFARALIGRLADDQRIPRPTVTARAARGGHGRALTELDIWQRSLARGTEPARADLLVVMIDGNGEGWAAQRRGISDRLHPGLFRETVIGCPDPHVEAWCAADRVALKTTLGVDPGPPPVKPGRKGYKVWLREALESAGIPVLNDAMDVAADLVPHIDPFRAAKASPSLGHFMDELSKALRRLGG